MLRSIIRWFTSEPTPLDNVSARVQQLLREAKREADRLGHRYVGTEHLLLGLLCLNSGRAISALERMRIDRESLRREVEKLCVASAPNDGADTLPMTPMFKKALRYGESEAVALGQTQLDSEHVLLGLLRLRWGVAPKALRVMKVDIESARRAVRELVADAHIS